jgi:hypothetical protein
VSDTVLFQGAFADLAVLVENDRSSNKPAYANRPNPT